MRNLPLLTLGLTFLYTLSFGQLYPPDGGHLPTIDWKQIDTDSLRVIFPAELEIQAQRIANVIHYINEKNSNSLGELDWKPEILLHNQTTVSNGFVGVGPYGSEFYSNAPQRSFHGTMDWLDILAIHEYRHIQQTQNAFHGPPKLAYWLSGESGWVGAAFFAIPNWFLEGDAVYQETALSSAGRGRLPEFLAGFRALSDEGIRYSYNKMRARSYKDIVPNHYPLGYLMSAYGRNHWGNDLWKVVTIDAADYKGILYPFSRSLKGVTGMGTPEFYSAMMHEMDSLYLEKRKFSKVSKGETLQVSPTPKSNNPTFYRFPVFDKNNKLYAVKQSFEKTAHYVSINPRQEEQTAFLLGLSLNRYVAKRGEKVAFDELRPHPRWGNVDYNNIVIYDLVSKKKTYLTKASKFFSPDISFDTTKLVVAEVLPNMTNQIVLLDIQTGDELERLDNPENYYFSFPKWTSTDTSIIAVAQKNQENALLQIHLATNKVDTLVPFSSYRITDLHIHEDWVLFASHFTAETQNIYGLQIGSDSLIQLTHTNTNAAYPCVSPDGKTLAFVRTHADGSYIHSIPFKPKEALALQLEFPKTPVQLNGHYIDQIQTDALEEVSDRSFSVKPYKETNHLLKLHTWLLQPAHPNYSILLESTNRLQTMGLYLQPGINTNEGSTFLRAGLNYNKLFPFLRLNFSNTVSRRTNFYERVDSTYEVRTRNWDESQFGFRARIPLNLTKGPFAKGFDLNVGYSLTDVRITNDTLYQEFSGQYNLLHLIAAYNMQQLTVLKQMGSRLGFGTRFGIRHNLRDSESQLQADLNIYLPGIAQTHAIQVDMSYRQQGFNNRYKFTDNYAYPRGYNAFQGDEMFRLGFNYRLPVWHPDLELGPFAFIKRFRTTVFYDYGRTTLRLENQSQSFNYSSVGLEFLADVHWFRTADFPLGVRISYLRAADLFGQNRLQFGVVIY